MRRFLQITLFLVVLSVALRGSAAQTTFEFFDLAACVHGTVGDELSGDDAYRENSPVQIKANGRWIFESTPGCYGFCRSIKDGFTCDLDSCPTFPLAGATFKIMKGKKGALASYQCASGCKEGVPKMIYDRGYENEDGEQNLELETMAAKFESHCKSAGKK